MIFNVMVSSSIPESKSILSLPGLVSVRESTTPPGLGFKIEAANSLKMLNERTITS